MNPKNIFYLFAALFFAILQLGIFHELWMLASFVSPTLLFLIYISTKFRNNLPYILAIVVGLVFDSFSNFFPGTFVLANVLVVIIVNFLFYKFFTNLSVIVFLTLGFVGSFIYYLFIGLVSLWYTDSFNNFVSVMTVSKNIFIAAIINCVILGLYFYLNNIIRHNFQKNKYLRMARYN